MTYQVLARKWRPRRFDDVVGQPPIVRTLKNALDQKRIAHAYCLSGIRGATGLLRQNPRPTRGEIIDGMNGHICRCDSYVQIIAAGEAAAVGDGGSDEGELP